MRSAAADANSIGSTRQRLRALVKSYKPELLACSLWPLLLMLTGLNVLSTWTPNLLLALGSDPGTALRSNTIMMAVGLGAALLGDRGLTAKHVINLRDDALQMMCWQSFTEARLFCTTSKLQDQCVRLLLLPISMRDVCAVQVLSWLRGLAAVPCWLLVEASLPPVWQPWQCFWLLCPLVLLGARHRLSCCPWCWCCCA